MDAAALWQRYQNLLYYNEGLGFYLDVSRMRFDDAFVEALQPKFNSAFAAMADLEQGGIANPDENRMVGHYWLRNPDLAPTQEIKQNVVQTVDKIEDFTNKILNGTIHPPQAAHFTDIISVGIGGSALGPQFVAEALAPDFPPLAIHFIDNTDPAGIDRILTRLRNRLASTLVLVISKSGGTPEPRNGMIEVKKAYAGHNLDFSKYAIAITSENSNLDNLAKSENWLATFPMYDWVGGRTSQLSAVGLLPAALQGIDIRAMIAGAKEMDSLTRIPDIKTNPAALLALAWYFAGNGRGEKDMVVLPYKDSLLLFSRYLQQLVMESLGKQKDLDNQTVNQGIAVYGNKGSTDQHAYVQQLREGIANFFMTFVEVLEDRLGPSSEVEPGVTSGDYLSGLLQGTRQALYENQRDSITVTISQLNPRMVGALIALYERAVGLYGFLINVNAYHQPGVEAGKKAAAAVLDLQRKICQVIEQEKTPLSLMELAEKAGEVDQVEVIYKILRHLHTNKRDIVLQGNLGEPNSLKISAL
ncbi:glucose-6-phosphate isomerase [Synechocystis sp. PCC 7509]|uniref:glucose-6-phosphate isomerase n=1 Tax=Synechocystis sp. PCC 7509 TaxID=927677 RepID=UPI0002ACE35F|nr:glucose-6-phosphate isomerase [Synechocystis sp. PCC 7509]